MSALTNKTPNSQKGKIMTKQLMIGTSTVEAQAELLVDQGLRIDFIAACLSYGWKEEITVEDAEFNGNNEFDALNAINAVEFNPVQVLEAVAAHGFEPATTDHMGYLDDRELLELLITIARVRNINLERGGKN